MIYDYILKSKKIVTLDDNSDQIKWIGVKGGKIAKTSTTEAIAEGEKVLDMGDKTIIPGLMDSHVHGGMSAFMMAGVNLSEATSIKEVLSLIEVRCKETDEAFVLAAFFIKPQIEEDRYPTREELDSVSNGKKVMVISITQHGSSINTTLFQSLEYPDTMEGLVTRQGNFTGELASDDAQFFTLGSLLVQLGPQEYQRYIHEFGRMCAQLGLTTVHCLEGQFVKDDQDIAIWIDLIAKGELPFHCVLYPQLWDYERASQFQLPRHGGCLTLDGADMDYTMALDAPYTCKPEVRGNLYHLDHEIYTLVSKAHKDGKQIAFHAMGDRAIDQILHIYRRVIMEQGDKGLRHRIEHFTMPTADHIKMAAELGVVVNYQPEYSYLFEFPGGPVEEWFGKERAYRFEQYKTVNDAGVKIAGGSDAPVNSLNPLTGIHALVNAERRERRFSVTEALEIYTKNVAYAAFEEKERGIIKEGFYADFTILDEDPYQCPEKINEISVFTTISEGRVVFEKAPR